MIFCKELNKEFSTKEQLFSELKENASKIISIKKKNIHTSYNAQDTELNKQIVPNNQIRIKSNLKESEKSLFKDNDYYYFAVNTTNILDSHGDLHVKGIWDKTAKEQNGKNYLVDTHSLTIKDVIAYPEDVEIFVSDIPFKSLGYEYKGDTQALIYKVHKDSIIGDELQRALSSNKTMQASVKMQYVKMELAMKSDKEEDAAERKVYDDYKNQIANINEFKEEPLYFFVQKEAKNIHESSLVPFGSNAVTGQIKTEPSIDTQQKEAVNDNTSHNSLLI